LFLKTSVLAIALLSLPAFAEDSRGMVRGHDVHNSVTTNPVAIATRSGPNLMYERSFGDHASGLLGVGSQMSSGSILYGGMIGVNFYLTGRHNDGLYLGPRLNLGFGTGRSTIIGSGSTTAGGRFADAFAGARGDPNRLGAELGYQWISGAGLTLGLAGGIDYGLGLFGSVPAPATNVFGNRLSPYGAVKVGWSW
jgi:hypothetical protein